MKVLRSIAAVCGGYFLLAAAAQLLFFLSGRNPHAAASLPFMVLTTTYGFLSAALAGYITARIAGRLALLHGAVLACLVALIAMISLLSELGSGAVWSQIAALLFMAPGVMIGAMIRTR